MKFYPIPKAALALLIAGLLITTLTPVISHHVSMPGSLKGFLNGLGLMIELLAIIKLRRSRKAGKCAL